MVGRGKFLPAGTMNRSRTCFFLILTGLVFSLFLLDRLFFTGIFRIPHHGSWDEDRWFTFEYHMRRLLRESECRKDDRPCVVVVGSSIAKYAVQKESLQKEIEKAYGRPVHLELLVHASMIPTDLRYYLRRMAPLGIDLVVYITGPADLDLSRITPPWEAGPAISEQANRNFLKDRIPAKLYYPAAYALELAGREDWQFLASRFVSASLDSLRFKGFWWDPVEQDLRSGRAKIKSYLNYQGIEIRPGQWREGNLGVCGSFPVEALKKNGKGKEGELFVQVLESQLAAGDFRIELYPQKDPDSPDRRGRDPDRCIPPEGVRPLAILRPGKAGWQHFSLENLPEKGRVFLLQNRVDSGTPIAYPVKAGDFVFAGRGVRLPGDFGLPDGLPVNGYLIRRRSLEDERILRMTDAELREDYETRVQPDDWRSPEKFYLRQMNDMRLGKYYTYWWPFEKDRGQAVEVVRFVREISPRMPILVINNAENPIALEDYGSGQWYRDFLEFYRSLEREYPGRFFFQDRHDQGRIRDFIDPHHLTYDGMIRMAPRYATDIAGALRRLGEIQKSPEEKP